MRMNTGILGGYKNQDCLALTRFTRYEWDFQKKGYRWRMSRLCFGTVPTPTWVPWNYGEMKEVRWFCAAVKYFTKNICFLGQILFLTNFLLPWANLMVVTESRIKECSKYTLRILTCQLPPGWFFQMSLMFLNIQICDWLNVWPQTKPEMIEGFVMNE